MAPERGSMVKFLRRFDGWMRNSFFDLLLAFSLIGQTCLFVWSIGNSKNEDSNILFWLSLITVISLGNTLLKIGKKST